jgi:hypothetical protein
MVEKSPAKKRGIEQKRLRSAKENGMEIYSEQVKKEHALSRIDARVKILDCTGFWLWC